MSLESSRKIFEQSHSMKSPDDIARQQEQTAHFDEQWEQHGTVRIAGEEFPVYHILPEHEESPVPTLVVPGWTATPEIMKENMRAIVGEGIQAISVDAPHGSQHSIDLPDHMQHIEDVELRRIAAFMSALDASKIAKTNAIGHSEGALNVLAAAAIAPERFGTIVLVNPAGMIADDDPLRLALRFSRDALRSWYFGLKQGTLKEKLRIDKLSFPSIAKDPKRSAQEVVSVGRSKIYELMREVSEAGVDIIVIHGPEDVAFPMHKIRATIQDMKDSPDEDITRLLRGMYSVAGDHNTFIRRAPENTRLAVSAIKARELHKQNSFG